MNGRHPRRLTRWWAAPVAGGAARGPATIGRTRPGARHIAGRRTARRPAGRGSRVRSRMRNASTRAAGRSLALWPRAGGIAASASSMRAASKLGGSISAGGDDRPAGRRSRRRDANAVRIGGPTQRLGRAASSQRAGAPCCAEPSSDEHDVPPRGVGAGRARPARAARPPRVREVKNGRDSARAASASRPIRASISKSSDSRILRRALRPGSRNCIAPQSITVSRRLLSRWMITGRRRRPIRRASRH